VKAGPKSRKHDQIAKLTKFTKPSGEARRGDGKVLDRINGIKGRDLGRGGGKVEIRKVESRNGGWWEKSLSARRGSLPVVSGPPEGGLK